MIGSVQREEALLPLYYATEVYLKTRTYIVNKTQVSQCQYRKRINLQHRRRATCHYGPKCIWSYILATEYLTLFLRRLNKYGETLGRNMSPRIATTCGVIYDLYKALNVRILTVFFFSGGGVWIIFQKSRWTLTCLKKKKIRTGCLLHLKEFLLPGVTPPWSNFKTKDLVTLTADPNPVVAHTKSYFSFLPCACLPSRPPPPPQRSLDVHGQIMWSIYQLRVGVLFLFLNALISR